MDTHSYDSVEMVVGTVFFTAALFCYPAALAYHLVFVGVRLSVLWINTLCGATQVLWHCLVDGAAHLAIQRAGLGTSAPTYLLAREPVPGSSNISGAPRERLRPHALPPSSLALLAKGFVQAKVDLHLPMRVSAGQVVRSVLLGRPAI